MPSGAQSVLVSSPSCAQGLVLSRLPAAAWRRLRFYEGPEYELRQVRVRRRGDRTTIYARTFWPRAGVAQLRQPWSQAAWRLRRAAKTVAAARAYMAYQEQSPGPDLDAVWRSVCARLDLAIDR
jgi:hypothetical protein